MNFELLCVNKSPYFLFFSFVNVSEWTVQAGPQPWGNGSDTFHFSHALANITLSKVTQSSSNIAVLQLKSSVELSEYVQTLCMDLTDQRTFSVGSTCWVVGWGKRRKNGGKVLYAI